MVRKRLPQPSPGELNVLSVLWELGPSTVKQVHARISRNHPVAKSLTTTLKVIQNMEQKGLVRREGEERPYLFHPEISKSEAQQGLLKDILLRGFQGSAKSLVLCALENADISHEEVDEIRALLNAHKKGGTSQ